MPGQECSSGTGIFPIPSVSSGPLFFHFHLFEDRGGILHKGRAPGPKKIEFFGLSEPLRSARVHPEKVTAEEKFIPLPEPPGELLHFPVYAGPACRRYALFGSLPEAQDHNGPRTGAAGISRTHSACKSGRDPDRCFSRYSKPFPAGRENSLRSGKTVEHELGRFTGCTH